jgi:hypothetical protein
MGVKNRCVVVALLLVLGCGGSGGGHGQPPQAVTPEFRAIAGVSMGAYGAMNLGTKHPELFGTIASLGGPVDMTQLLRDTAEGLTVSAQTAIPRTIGDAVTFDRQLPYPGRDLRISQLQDVVLAFGNPFLHHPDPEHQYLARDSEPARFLNDDAFGPFTIPGDGRGFLDGGDRDANGLRETSEAPTLSTDVLLAARGSLAMIAGVDGVVFGERALADLDGDGVFDAGDGIVLNFSEPFTDANDNGVFEPGLGETFSDVGLDGVAGTGDFGEGNGVFDYDPDRAHWLAEDPLSRLATRSAADIATQRIYMDVGTKDEFGFARHYANLVAVLQAKGLTVRVEDGFPGNCIDLPNPSEPFLLVRYDAGHVGFKSVDPQDLLNGNPCGDATIWQRIVNMIGYLNESFPDGIFGIGSDLLPNPDPTGDIVRGDIPSPTLATGGGSVPVRPMLVYRPPAFFHGDAHFPIVYFLGGYGQEPDDFARIQVLLDGLILTGQLQNMFFAFLPGGGSHKGSFYVNHVVSEAQAPGVPTVTSGRYEDSILADLIPVIERDVCEGRVR